MIKTNLEQLVEMGVAGEVCHPHALNYRSYSVGYNGAPFTAVGFSGICYNVKVGDSAFGWASADHVEPGVGIKNPYPHANDGLFTLACIGNEATIVAAGQEGKDAKLKGNLGVVTGKQDGRDVVSLYFSKKVLESLSVGDRIQIRACGVGLKLPDYPDVTVLNCGPRLFKVLNPSERGGKVRIPVAKIIPGKIMGAGIGTQNAQTGDFDIQCASPEAVKEYSLDAIRIGDMVAITDYDATFGMRWQQGAIAIGAVVHGASFLAGHGPGVNILFSSPKGTLEPIITRKANIAELLGLA